MKKVLFIDRDGTLIVEPPDEQIDSLEKLEFVPGAISGMKSISQLGYELVLASNQDGMGTDRFPENAFLPPHKKMLRTLEGEGVRFDDMLIDRSLAEENLPTRKPGIGMFAKYLSGDYDMSGSYVIGDRITDALLARNLGAKAILIRQNNAPLEEKIKDAQLEPVVKLIADRWEEIVRFLRSDSREAAIERQTRETDISLWLDIDGGGESSISTGLHFLDHQLWQIVHHGGISLKLKAVGDLDVDEHHTMEDVAIVLGEAVNRALGDKRGIERYGFALPMDDSAAIVLIDFGGRIDFRWKAKFKREMIGDTPTELFEHFFRSFSQGARCNLHITAKGDNEHHKIEAIFKAFARALKAAVRRDVFSYKLPSSKGLL